MKTEKLHRRMKKLLALAEAGIDGEKTTAERMLNKLLKIHNLTIADIEGDEKSRKYFKCGTKAQNKRLMVQVITSTCGAGADLYSHRPFKGVYFVDVTAEQAAEIELKFFSYKKALEEVLEIAFIGFVHKHKLYSPTNPDDKKEESTPEERAQHFKALKMAGSMATVNLNKQLEKL